MTGSATSFVAGRPWFVALARLANLTFFLITATYCLLSYSPFAYQNFIRPHMVAALATFVVWHGLWFWLMFALTALTMTGRTEGRWLRVIYLIVSFAVGVLLSVKPILPQVDNSSARGLVLAAAALVWPLWLAICDHMETSHAFGATPSDPARLAKAALLTAGFVWASQLAAIPWRLDLTGDIPLTGADITFGAAASLVAHLAIFGTGGLLTAFLLKAFARGASKGLTEYWRLVVASSLLVTFVLGRLVFGLISFTGAVAWAIAALAGTTIVLAWSGIARRLLAGREDRPAIDAWLAPLGTVRSWWVAVLALAAVAAAEQYALDRAATFDWDFLVQKLIVLAVWLVAFSMIHSALKQSRAFRWSLVGVPFAAVVLCGSPGAIEPAVGGLVRERPFVSEFIFDGYVGLDTSFRLIRDAFWTEPPGSAAFYRRLAANTLLERFDIQPVRNAPRLGSGAPQSKPDIFLITVDSLRPDYLSPYSRTVSFTPNIQRFADESVVFRHAFTRYGGTGLSMPAIWAGAMMIHKQYVTPFEPMNLLEQLLDADGYQMWLSMDHITSDILSPKKPAIELDHGRDEMDFDVCQSFDEIDAALLSSGGRAPIFAHTRSLNLHVSKLRHQTVPDNPAYRGLQGPAASAVERIDGCFGRFVAFLKAHDLYDSSIVILMSDHGDSLGEEGRWGHAMTLFPEVVRIPLIVHVPKDLERSMVVNRDAPVFSIDLAPTLCALLGYESGHTGPFFGIPLLETNRAAIDARGREPQLLASSYGPVYGLLSSGGRTLYIADAVNRRDYKYDITGATPVRLGVTPEERAADRQIIEEKLDDLAALYHFSPEL